MDGPSSNTDNALLSEDGTTAHGGPAALASLEVLEERSNEDNSPQIKEKKRRAGLLRKCSSSPTNFLAQSADKDEHGKFMLMQQITLSNQKLTVGRLGDSTDSAEMGGGLSPSIAEHIFKTQGSPKNAAASTVEPQMLLHTARSGGSAPRATAQIDSSAYVKLTEAVLE